jgi:two-component system, LytTR family, sensor kinase
MPTPRQRQGLSPWLTSLLFWSIPALLSSVHTWWWNPLIGRPISFARAALSEAPPWLVLALVSPPLLVMLERRHAQMGALRRWILPAAALVSTSVVILAVFALAYISRQPDHSVAAFLRVLPHAAISFLPVVMLSFVVLERQARALARARDAERAEQARAELALQLAAAQIRAVEDRLHPHFLFNTLDSVVALLREGKTPVAIRATVLLSELLRSLLAWRGTPLIPLRAELEMVRKYVELEELRFSDRLRVEWLVESSVMDVLVPPLVLQPLVENAVRHGIQQRVRAGLLRIGGRELEGELELWVDDDGPGPSGAALSPSGQGLGLCATRERISRQFGTSAGLDLLSRAEGGASARVHLPLTRENAGAL